MNNQEHLFRTKIEIPKWDKPMSASDHVVFLGSCFAQYIGERFESFGLHSLCNPLGVLYNPESIRLQVHAALHVEEIDIPVFRIEEEWRCWWSGTQICGSSEQECRNVVEGALQMLRLSIQSADYLFVTLGTNVCYQLKSTGLVVANCHKAPSKLFSEEWLSLPDCIKSLMALVEDVHEQNPNLKIVFTISPFRYAKYGFHGNQLAKSTLMLAVEEVSKTYPDWVRYFPAYEIMMDELRDYRFYSEDMLHPSVVAVNYIWECMVNAVMSSSMQEYLQEYASIQSGLRHTPRHPDSPGYKMFLESLEEKEIRLKKKYNVE
jgi:hypothetical protein